MGSRKAGIRLLVTLFWFFLIPWEGEANSPVFKLLYPPDRTVYGGAGLAHVVIEASPSTKIAVSMDGKPVESAKIRGNIYHFALSLKFGLNRIEVEARAKAKVLARETRKVFFFSPIAERNEIPKGFAASPFHQTGERHGECAACHNLEPQKSDFAPPNPRASSCHGCHQGLTRFKQVHGPASLWNCLKCHDPASSPARYGTPVPVRDLCFRCHTKLRDYFFASRYQHGPTATGMCTICHNPHASNNEFWLKKDPWDLCTTCHVEKASGRHIIAWGPTGDTHPTRGRPDPMKPDREFSCRSCHNPHASNAPKLWNFGATTAYQLCWTCHRK